MNDFVMPLMLGLDVSSLTMALVTIASARGEETALADSVEAALRPVAHLHVDRVGDTVIARTDAGHQERVLVAGRLDTAPLDQEPLAYVEMGKLLGPGACDAKGALAVTLKAAAAGGYGRDVTFVLHADGQGTEQRRTFDDEVRRADFVLLAEPTGSAVRGALDHPWAKHLTGLTDADPAPDAGGGRSARRLAHVTSLDVAAVAFGPGDPSVAGTPDEFVPTAELNQCEFVLRQWLST